MDYFGFKLEKANFYASALITNSPNHEDLDQVEVLVSPTP